MSLTSALLSVQTVKWNKRLKYLKMLRGWTQKQAAEHCETYQKNYAQWELGEVTSRTETMIKIAKAFEIEPYEIFGEMLDVAG